MTLTAQLLQVVQENVDLDHVDPNAVVLSVKTHHVISQLVRVKDGHLPRSQELLQFGVEALHLFNDIDKTDDELDTSKDDEDITGDCVCHGPAGEID